MALSMALKGLKEEEKSPSSSSPSRRADGESIGHHPLSQGCFMILRLKGAMFSVTTTGFKRKPVNLQSLTPGIHTPFITFNSEVKTDVNKIEESLEQVLSSLPHQVLKSFTKTPRVKHGWNVLSVSLLISRPQGQRLMNHWRGGS
jgi:chloride intracellular channel protein 4